MLEPRTRHEPLRYFAEDQEWDGKTMKQLKDKYNVIFNRGIWAFMVLWGKTGRPLIVLGHEDDGMITFERKYGQFTHCFSPYWIDSIIAGLRVTQQYVKG